MNQKKKQEYSREVKDPNIENQGYCSAHDNHFDGDYQEQGSTANFGLESMRPTVTRLIDKN